MIRYLPFLLVLAVWIYAFIDCLNTPEKEIRKLPKIAWVLIILLFGQVLLGPIAWFAVGRPRRNTPYGATKPQERRWVAPDDNPDFLKSINDKDKDKAPGSDPGQRPDEPSADKREAPGESPDDEQPKGRPDSRRDSGPDEDGSPPAGS